MVNCEEVLRELSNYLDGELHWELRKTISEHFRFCRRCSVICDSMRKVIYIVGDDRVIEVPDGYSERLHTFLKDHLESKV